MKIDKLIFTEPIFFNRIWGGDKILKYLNSESNQIPIGEAWGISGHKSGDCLVLSGKYKGIPLSQVISKDKSILGETMQEMPIQIRMLDSKSDLSIQVHPSQTYAKIHSNDNGKNECWYIIDCENNATLVYGHEFLTKDEFKNAIVKNKIMTYLNYIPIKKGDLVYVPTGLIHAMTKNITAIEISDSSDTTYRVYDYNRIDKNGNKREIHLEKSLDVIDIPCKYPNIIETISIGNGFFKRILLDNENFFISNLKTLKNCKLEKKHPYYACFVVEGTAFLNGIEINKGDFFILTSLIKDLVLEGKVEILLSYSKKYGGY